MYTKVPLKMHKVAGTLRRGDGRLRSLPPVMKGGVSLSVLCSLLGRLVCTRVMRLLLSPPEEELTLRQHE